MPVRAVTGAGISLRHLPRYLRERYLPLCEREGDGKSKRSRVSLRASDSMRGAAYSISLNWRAWRRA